MKTNMKLKNIIKKAMTGSLMVIALAVIIVLPIMAETPQTDAKSDLPYYNSGFDRPKRLRYSFDIKNYSATLASGYAYLNDGGFVYWPNSQTGNIDALAFTKIYITDRTTYEKKVRFQIDGTGSEEFPQYYIEIKLQNQPYTFKCVGYYDQDQVYNMDDIKTIAPGFEIYNVAQKGYYSTFFNETTFPYIPLGAGGVESPEVKQNIFGSMRDLINNNMFNGEAVQGTIEYNIATLIAIICCIAIVMLPFLACWGIVRVFIWR